MRIYVEDWYDIHRGYMLTLYPGVTCLVGPNGAGKTTLLTYINEYAESNHIPAWKYSNYADGKYEDYRYLETDTRLFAQTAFASEGEKVAMHFSGRVGEIGRLVTESRKTKQPAFVLLDALDSGASIDRARDLFELFKMIDDVTAGIIADGGEPVEVAVRLCLYCMKTQVFNDGNKRAAVIFANHYLIGQAAGLLVIPEKDVPEFKRLLVAYYEDKDSGEMVGFMKKKCWRRM